MKLINAARILFLLLCIAAGIFSFSTEKHEVYSLSGPEPRQMSGLQFTEAASFDGVMLRDGRLYDIYSLTGMTLSGEGGAVKAAGAAGGTSKPKDCKT